MNLTCPLCGHQDHTVVYSRLPQCPDADIVKCDHCGHFYTLLKKDIDVDNLYADEIYKVVENRNSVFDRILDREYKGTLKKLKAITKQTGSLLDFGSGKGKFGSLAKESGWEVKCVETSPDRAAYAKNIYGLEVNTAFYSGGNIFDTWFDALTLFHVLEHLPNPKPLLEQLIKDNLKKNGIVVIEVPNMRSWQSRITGDRWIHLDVPRHIHHFTPERLELFLQEIGLRPLKRTYFSFHLGVLGMVDSLLKLFGYKKNIIYELKNRTSRSLVVKVAILLPFAILMERIASGLGRGGVIRVYAGRTTE
jgi:2-polyprenyl-3-methyl-5-hydroxy-6-metoxy-1,4-benzoquinol methylase